MGRPEVAERGIPVVLPEGAQGSAIVSLAMPKAEEVKKKLEEAGVVVSLRAGRIRVSPHCYNRLEDIHRLYEVIDKVIK